MFDESKGNLVEWLQKKIIKTEEQIQAIEDAAQKADELKEKHPDYAEKINFWLMQSESVVDRLELRLQRYERWLETLMNTEIIY